MIEKTERELNPETTEPTTPAYKLLHVPRNTLVDREREKTIERDNDRESLR